MAGIDEAVNDAVEKAENPPGSGLNSAVAALVAVLATAMALCNIKDGNLVQAMQQAQASAIDSWSYYQAKSTKQHLAEETADQLSIQLELGRGLDPAARELVTRKIGEYQDLVKKYGREKEEIKAQAEAHQREYDRLNYRDDQFDMADAGLSLSIALLGIAALTKKRWLVGVAVVFASLGLLMGAAGFFGWAIHPDRFARFLS